MFENIISFFKKIGKKEENKKTQENSKDAAKERLHLVLMQDRANVSADFLELMKQEIIDVIKKYIEVDENEIDVRLTNKENEDGTNGAPALYANIPILNIKNDARKVGQKEIEEKKEQQQNDKKENENKQETTTKEQTQTDEKNKEIENNKKEENNQKEEDINKEETNTQPKNNQEEKTEKLESTQTETNKTKEVEKIKNRKKHNTQKLKHKNA